MHINFTAIEARVMGSLIEKELTTPDYYPLSLHALTAACNQKSNREPVMNLSEVEVQAALDALIKQNLAARRSDFSARVPKYAHKLAGTLTRAVDFSRAELAVICALLLRGPPTPGELRSRAARMHPFTELAEVTAVLTGVAARTDDPVVTELPRQAGRREARYACLWVEAIAADAPPLATNAEAEDHEARLARLVAALHQTAQHMRNVP